MQYIPRYNQMQQLSPDQQRLLGLQTQQQYNLGQTGVEQSAKLRQLLGQSVDTSGLQGWNAGPQAANLATTFGGQGDVRQDQGPTDRAAIENAMMASYNRSRAPQTAAENAQLAARGLSPGSAGYGTVQTGREDAAGEAARQAYMAWRREHGRRSMLTTRRRRNVSRRRRHGASFPMPRCRTCSTWAASGRPGECLAPAAIAGTAGAQKPADQRDHRADGRLGGHRAAVQPVFGARHRRGTDRQYIGQNYANQAAAAAQQNQGLFGLGGAALGGIGAAGGFGGLGGFFR